MTLYLIFAGILCLAIVGKHYIRLWLFYRKEKKEIEDLIRLAKENQQKEGGAE